MSRAIFVVSILAALVSNPRMVVAAPPQAVTITQHSSRGCPTPCTFVATGAISDSGFVTLDDEHDGALPSPVVGTAHVIRTFHGQAGTLTIRLETLLTLTAVPSIGQEQGRWVVVDGTGAYAGLSGEGKETGTRDFAAQTLV